MCHEPDSLLRAAAWLGEARRLVVFTGAGASAQSGIPTFRDDDGLWRTFPPEDFANWAALLRMALTCPARVADFLYALLQPLAAAQPNPGHRAIAALDRHLPATVVTQNIDGLHQDAGSSRVLEVHGSLLEIVSASGRPLRRLSRADLREIAARLDRLRHGRLVLPRMLAAVRKMAGIGRGWLHRPNVVLFGDAMAEPAWGLAQDECRRCDLMLQVGCSGAVWPAAMLPELARRAGARVVAVDPNPTPADLWLQGTAAEIMPPLVRRAFDDPQNRSVASVPGD